MAKQVILERDGIAKPSYVGFSWTIFFFGAWVPLIRGRYLDALVMFMVTMIVAYFTHGAGGFIFNIILSFFYNKYATEQMLKEGYYPVDETSAFLLKQHGIYFKSRD
jgi:hypothetical protein